MNGHRMLALVLVATTGVGGASPLAAQGTPGRATVVLAGGCFWGVESVFRHVRGVESVVSGFAVPSAGTGDTNAAEAVRLTYDPGRLTYRQILTLFFSVVHDPTEGDRQGPDVGAEYRSVLFVGGARERALARAYVDSLAASHAYSKPITTQVTALAAFHPAEEFHQDYAAKHPDDPYIVVNDRPKVAALRKKFPALFKARPGEK